MRPSQKSALRFSALLSLSLLIAFLAQVAVRERMGLPKYAHEIVPSYLLNGLLAAGIYLAIFRFRSRLRNQIGFLFLAGSIVKFTVFFLFFYPTYSLDGTIERSEFAAFFVPYLISLFLETFYMGKMLNKME